VTTHKDDSEKSYEELVGIPAHWYKTIYEECPTCGRGNIYRVREYTPRPDDPSERTRFEYVGCAGAAGCWGLL
jgi:hypothetical protein